MTTPLYFLSGPTASGKTDLAHTLADQMGLRLLSVDSMMVYRGMNIGTAKPSDEEIEKYDYAGLNLVDPGTPFSVGDWLRTIQKQLDGRPTLAVGGTGLYFRAITSGLEEQEIATPSDLPSDIQGLQQRLHQADPKALSQLSDPENPRRLERAIAWREAGLPLPHSWSVPDVPIPVLQRDPQELATRIHQRVIQMMNQGLLEETQTLLNAGSLTGTATQAIGYAEATALLHGTLSKEDIIEKIATRTRQYAKRQRTWFRNQMKSEWIQNKNKQTALDDIQNVWEQTGPYLFVQ